MKAEAPYIDGITCKCGFLWIYYLYDLTLNPTGLTPGVFPRDSFSTETPFRFGDLVTLEVCGGMSSVF